jgi:hypothetical protein
MSLPAASEVHNLLEGSPLFVAVAVDRWQLGEPAVDWYAARE